MVCLYCRVIINILILNTMENIIFNGLPDVSLEISLKEYKYGLFTNPKYPEDIMVIYEAHPERYDIAYFPPFVPEVEFNWVDLDNISNFCGYDVSKQDNKRVIMDLISYYGFENVCGSSYWEGFTFEEIENSLNTL